MLHAGVTIFIEYRRLTYIFSPFARGRTIQDNGTAATALEDLLRDSSGTRSYTHRERTTAGRTRCRVS